MPVSDIGYYFVTIGFCSIIHEIGHAVAAFKEGIHIFGVGLVIIFIIPVAFVKINSEEISALHPIRQLRIFCAGIWHNIVLSLLAYLFLLSLPFLLSSLYEVGRGVSVLNVHEVREIMKPLLIKFNNISELHNITYLFCCRLQKLLGEVEFFQETNW